MAPAVEENTTLRLASVLCRATGSEVSAAECITGQIGPTNNPVSGSTNTARGASRQCEITTVAAGTDCAASSPAISTTAAPAMQRHSTGNQATRRSTNPTLRRPMIAKIA